MPVVHGVDEAGGCAGAQEPTREPPVAGSLQGDAHLVPVLLRHEEIEITISTGQWGPEKAGTQFRSFQQHIGNVEPRERGIQFA